MAFQFVLAITIVAASSFVSAGIVPVAPAGPVLAKIEDFDHAPQSYSFAYDVQDSLTGDSKAQYETRNGDVVTGSYSLIEADGSRRIVKYTADDVNGFNAVVSREPAVVAAPVIAKSVVPVAPAAPVVAAPIVAKSAPIVAAPFAYATYPRAVATRFASPYAPYSLNYAAPAIF